MITFVGSKVLVILALELCAHELPKYWMETQKNIVIVNIAKSKPFKCMKP